MPGHGLVGRGDGAVRGGFLVGEDGHEGAVADHGDRLAGRRLDRALVKRRHLRAGARRPEHARVPHTGEVDVVDKAASRQLYRKIGPRRRATDDPIGLRRLRRDIAPRRVVQVQVAGDGPVVEAGRRAAAEEDPLLDLQGGRRHAETPRGDRDQVRAHLGADPAQGRAAGLDGQASHRQTLVRTLLGVADPDPHLIKAQVQFLGGDLAGRRKQALAQLRLADADADMVVWKELHPVAEAFAGHGRASAIRLAASSTASRMRLWSPQRQRCQSRARAMVSRLGFGSRASRAAALTSTPDRQ